MFQSLEALRAAAAALVVLFHTQSIVAGRSGDVPFANLFAAGDRGVDLFFVLSGFIITYVHFQDIGRPRRIGVYAYSRFCRIFPLVWIVSAAALAVYGAGFDGAKMGKLEFPQIVASLLLLPQDGVALVNVTWTLKYEIFFYGLFGLLIFSRRLGLLALAAWQAAILVCAVAAIDTSSLWGYYFRPIGLEFGIGCLVGLWAIATGRRVKAPAAIWPALALAAGSVSFAATMLAQAYAPAILAGLPRFVTFGSSAGLIVMGCCQLERRGLLPVPNLLILLGNASYAIYLIHFSAITLVVTLFVRAGLTPAGTAAGGALAAFGLAAGLGFYYWADRPIARRLGQLRRSMFGGPAKSAVRGDRIAAARDADALLEAGGMRSSTVP